MLPAHSSGVTEPEPTWARARATQFVMDWIVIVILFCNYVCVSMRMILWFMYII